MKRPKQLPAVDRNARKCAAIPVGANVGPSAWWNTLLDVAKVVAPIAISAL